MISYFIIGAAQLDVKDLTRHLLLGSLTDS